MVDERRAVGVEACVVDAVIEEVLGEHEFGRLVVVAPVRRAFDATMRDPEFLAEAEKSKTDISAMTGEEAQKIAAATINAAPAVRARAAALIEGK